MKLDGWQENIGGVAENTKTVIRVEAVSSGDSKGLPVCKKGRK